MRHSGLTQSRHWAGVVVAFPNFGVRLFMSRLREWSLPSWSCGESIVTGSGKEEEKERSSPSWICGSTLDSLDGPPTAWVPPFSPTYATPSRTVADNEETWPTSCRNGEGPIVTTEVRRRPCYMLRNVQYLCVRKWVPKPAYLRSLCVRKARFLVKGLIYFGSVNGQSVARSDTICVRFC